MVGMKKAGYFLILPSLAILLLVELVPIGYSIYMSFQKFFVLSIAKPKFTGLDNYRMLTENPVFWIALKNTLIWVVTTLSATFTVGLLTATVLNRNFWGRNIVRNLVLLPWVVPGAAACFVWGLMYSPRYGVINQSLVKLGLSRFAQFSWLGKPSMALWAVILVSIWKSIPFVSIMLLAALQSIPEVLYDAAEVDGASLFQKFRFVTIPSIKPVLLMLLMLSVLWSFKSFMFVHILTGGGPNNASQILGTLAYYTAFVFFRWGRASAIGVTMLVILLAFSYIYYKGLVRKKG